MTARRAPGEGGIYCYQTTKGQQWYYKCSVQLADGTRKIRVKRGYRTKEDARLAMRKLLAEADKGNYTEPSQRTLESWLTEWVKGPWQSEKTADTYRRVCDLYITPTWGRRRISEITRLSVRQGLASLRDYGGHKGDPLSARTVSQVRATLHNIMDAAVDEGLLAINPVARARRDKRRERIDTRIRVWSVPQVTTFLNWAAEHDPDHYVLFYLIANTGLRVSEVTALQWRDIGTTDLAVREGKGNRHRNITMHADLKATLRTYRAARASVNLDWVRPAAYVFTTDGSRWSRHTPASALTRAITRARNFLAGQEIELPQISIHDLRHTAASLMLSAGVPLPAVSAMLGHARVTTTLAYYAHCIPGDQDVAADAMNKIMSAVSRAVSP